MCLCNPTTRRRYLLVASALTATRRPTAAFEILRKLKSEAPELLAPNHANPMLRHNYFAAEGDALVALSQWSEAADSYRVAIATSQHDEKVFYRCARALARVDRHNEAVAIAASAPLEAIAGVDEQRLAHLTFTAATIFRELGAMDRFVVMLERSAGLTSTQLLPPAKRAARQHFIIECVGEAVYFNAIRAASEHHKSRFQSSAAIRLASLVPDAFPSRTREKARIRNVASEKVDHAANMSGLPRKQTMRQAVKQSRLQNEAQIASDTNESGDSSLPLFGDTTSMSSSLDMSKREAYRVVAAMRSVAAVTPRDKAGGLWALCRLLEGRLGLGVYQTTEECLPHSRCASESAHSMNDNLPLATTTCLISHRLIRTMRRTAVAAATADPLSVPALLTVANDCLAARNFKAAICLYRSLRSMVPHEPIIALSLAVAFMCRAISSRTRNRHAIVVQGCGLLALYWRLRRVEQTQRRISMQFDISAAASASIRCVAEALPEGAAEAEVWYNVGRAMHILSLFAPAVAAYERCLATVAGVPSGSSLSIHSEAAYNYGLLLRTSGNTHRYATVMSTFLCYD